MLHLKLFRTENTPVFCRGRLYAADDDDEELSPSPADSHPGECLICDTIEPPVRRPSGFVRGGTAVQAGVYRVALSRSPKFGRLLPILMGVPGMTGVRIHRGNTVADTRGCILPGRYVGGGRVVESTPREQELVRMILGCRGGADIEIVDDFATPESVVSEEPSPSFSSWPLASVAGRSVWDRLRLAVA